MSLANINTLNGLSDFLKSRVGVVYESDDLEVLLGNFGKYKGYNLAVTFKYGDYLLVSLLKDGEGLLKELEPVFSEVMGESPVCTYDVPYNGPAGSKVLFTVEWAVKELDSRLRDVVNGRAYSSDCVVKNINLLGRDINKYIESDKEKAKVLADARIYGIDPGCLTNPEEVKQMSEVDLYHLIDSLGGIIWTVRHATKRDLNPPSLIEEQYALEFCVYQAKKYVDDLSEPQFNKHIQSTEKYWKWFKFYDGHFKSFTDERWCAYQEAKEKGEDVSQYMPIGDWKETKGN